ncbi:MAG: BTAD domain-containing putative transcriptional regulator [Acidimicrobiales bacterium]
MTSPHIRLLGAVGFVTERGEVVKLPSPAQRRLLAALALASGATQRTEYLSDALEVSAGSLRTTVSRLRSRIGENMIRTDTAGYRITCAIDATMFTDLLVERPDHVDRLVAVEDALALWHGEALDEFSHEAWAAPEVARLDELRALAVEDRAELLISRSRAGEAVAALEALVAANPLRDRPRGLLVQALATSGRQAEALRAYQSYRTYLAEETGTAPSAAVQSIERRVAAGLDTAAAVAPARSRPGPEAPVDVPLPGHLFQGPALIGRQREITWLESDLVAARSGSMRAALLGGEAGIGKTTLLAAFARAQHQQAGNVVVFGRCAEGAAVPLEPFLTILAALVKHAPLALLQEHTERCGGELLRVAPRLADRLWAPPPVAADDATERYQLFEAVTDLLRRVASSGSLTLILDDLHWAEPTALLLLRHLGRALVDAPVLLIASYRDTVPDATPELRSALVDLERGRCRRLCLTGFDDAELGRLLRAVTGSHEEPDGAVLAQLHAETAGNPLYAAQLVRHLWESELLSVTANEISFAGEVPHDALPRSLLEVVWSRVRALGPPAVAVLRSAAVLGTDFARDALVTMTELSGEEVASAVDLAMAAGLLGETGDGQRPLRFTHALVHHALYSELSLGERRRLHQRAADGLRGVRPLRPDIVVALARHTALAGDLTAAQHWAVVAAAHASEHLAPAEAAAWYDQALALADERHAPEAERAGLMVLLGEAQHRAGDPRTHDTLRAAANLARRAGAGDVLVRAALANDRGFSRVGVPDEEQLAILEAAIAAADPTDTARLARLLACRAQELVHTPNHELRLASARQAIDLVDGSDDARLLPQVISALVFGLWGPDTLALRRDLALRAVRTAAKAVDPFLEFWTNRAAYFVAIECGDASEAAASLGRIREITAEIPEPRLQWILEVCEGFEATMQARFEDADAHTQRMFDIGTEIGEPDAFPLYAAQLFANRSFAGRYDEVIPLLEQAMDATPDSLPFRLAHAISCSVVGREREAQAVLDHAASTRFADIATNWTWMTTVIGYAVLAIELEDAAAAADLYPLLEPFADQVAFNGATSQGYVGAYIGKLASLLGEHDVADGHLHRALDLNRAFGWTYHEATTLVALARSQHRRTGFIDEVGRRWLGDAEAISRARGIRLVTAEVDHLQANAGPGR